MGLGLRFRISVGVRVGIRIGVVVGVRVSDWGWGLVLGFRVGAGGGIGV